MNLQFATLQFTVSLNQLEESRSPVAHPSGRHFQQLYCILLSTHSTFHPQPMVSIHEPIGYGPDNHQEENKWQAMLTVSHLKPIISYNQLAHGQNLKTMEDIMSTSWLKKHGKF